jgi:hypothetical protein
LQELYQYLELMRLGPYARGLRLRSISGTDLPLDNQTLALCAIVAPSIVAAVRRVRHVHLACSSILDISTGT